MYALVISIQPVEHYAYTCFTGDKEHCAQRLAWWLVFEKYPNLNKEQCVNGRKCTCDFTQQIQPDCDIHCDIHGANGYFRRLASRLARRILACWPE